MRVTKDCQEMPVPTLQKQPVWSSLLVAGPQRCGPCLSTGSKPETGLGPVLLAVGREGTHSGDIQGHKMGHELVYVEAN